MKKLLPLLFLITALTAGCTKAPELKDAAEGVTLDFFLLHGENFSEPLQLLTVSNFRYMFNSVDRDHFSPSLTIVLEPEDAAAFHKITKDHQGETLAVYCGERKLLEARLMEPIPGGEIRISGLDEKELVEIRLVLEGKQP